MQFIQDRGQAAAILGGQPGAELPHTIARRPQDADEIAPAAVMLKDLPVRLDRCAADRACRRPAIAGQVPHGVSPRYIVMILGCWP